MAKRRRINDETLQPKVHTIHFCIYNGIACTLVRWQNVDRKGVIGYRFLILDQGISIVFLIVPV